jgi:hypothetical protein
LPTLFSPLIRLELIDWNPLLGDNRKLENFDWFNTLIDLNVDDLNKNENFLLIPMIIEKIVLNRLISITNDIYDPFSSLQTKRFSDLVVELINNYPTINSQSENTKNLIESIIKRLIRSIDNDIFIPLYAKHIIEQVDNSNKSSQFFYRQLWSCFRLIENILKWQRVVSSNTLKELVIDRLINRYLIIALQNMPMNTSIKYIEYLINKLPKEWLKENVEATGCMDTPQIANLLRLLNRILASITIGDAQNDEMIKRIRKLFISIGATDQAITLSNKYQLG